MEIIQVVVAVVIATSGWAVVHFYAQQRDVANKQREFRLKALEKAYLSLLKIGVAGLILEYDEEENLVVDRSDLIEEAIAIIHLYGTNEQSRLATKYSIEVGDTNGGQLTDLVNSLRADIRQSLAGQDIDETPKYVKITKRKNGLD